MIVLTVLCRLAPDAMIRFFNADPAVVAFGAEYLRIIGLELRGLRPRLRQLERVPGDGATRCRRWPVRSLRLLLFAVPAYALSAPAGVPRSGTSGTCPWRR